MPSLRPVGIAGTGSEVPSRILSNLDLEKMVETTDEWITRRTGIKERRIADPEVATSDLAYGAAVKALDAAGVRPEDLDLIIVSTVTPDMFFPATACIVQAKLGATRAAAFDLSAGCSGFIYGVVTASNFIATGMCDNVLVIGADCLSKITNYQDRSTCILFGDAASAAVLKPVESGLGILSTALGADGSGGENLTAPAGGSRMPATAETVEKGLHYIHMCGAEVMKFAVRVMDSTTRELLDKAGLATSDVDVVIPHQANIRIIEAAVDRLGIDRERFFVNVEKYGNTSAASVGLALDEAVKEGRLKRGDVVVLVGFGAGLTWGGCCLKWSQGQ